MKKRILATGLWGYTAWYAGAIVAALIGVDPLIGPVLAIGAALLVGLDPRHAIWDRPQERVGARDPNAARAALPVS